MSCLMQSFNVQLAVHYPLCIRSLAAVFYGNIQMTPWSFLVFPKWSHTEPILPICRIRKLRRAPETPVGPLALKDDFILV